MILIRLVLPAPFGPEQADDLAAPDLSDTDVSAGRLPYRLLMPEHHAAPGTRRRDAGRPRRRRRRRAASA